jgi:hypothetical protein
MISATLVVASAMTKPTRLLLGVVLALAATASGAEALPAAPGTLAVDLLTVRVNGHVVLGRSVAGVTAAFGRPSWRVRGKRLYRIGYGDRENPAMVVLFRKRGEVLRAATVAFEKPPLVEPRLGRNGLAMTPRSFARTVERKYPSAFGVELAPTCAQARCITTLQAVDSARRLTFGQRRGLGSYLSIWQVG